MRVVLGIVCIVSALFAPWWVTTGLGVFVALQPVGAVVLLSAGVLMDSLYGAPIHVLGGFQFLYTAVFLVIVSVVFLLRNRVVD